MIGTRKTPLNTKIEPSSEDSKKQNVDGGTCLDLFALNVSTDFASKNFVLFAKVLRTLLTGRCLGFAPRSESFAIEPAVQACSISSLSGLALRRPSATPLNPKKSG